MLEQEKVHNRTGVKLSYIMTVELASCHHILQEVAPYSCPLAM